MPRSKLGVKKPPVDPGNLKKAVEAVLAPFNYISMREACVVYNVKLATLSRHVTKFRNSEAETFEYRSNLDVKKVFSEEEENSLLQYIKNVSRMNYGLTKKGVRELAYKYATANNKKYPQGWDDEKIAGEEWMRGFLGRHMDLSIRKPRATSLSRATSFNKNNVDLFYKNIETVHKRDGPIPPDRIWNCDESGLSTVQTPAKVVAPRGARQVGSTTSAERGSLVTMLTSINASGNSTPPLLIFPRVNYKDRMLYGAPPGSIGAATPTGWSNEDTFIQYLKHFIKSVKPSREEKVILFMDNHETHLSVEAVNLASDSGVVVVTFPPHCSHKLQPLDVSVFGPFKTFYNQYVDAWLVNHPGQTFNIYGVAEVVGKAYPRAFTPNNIMKGFKATGIFPFDKNVFSDEDFLPSYVTDRPNPVPPCPNGRETNNQQTENIINDASNLPSCSTAVDLVPTVLECRPIPGSTPHRVNQDIPMNNAMGDLQKPANSSVGSTFLSPEDVQPFPKAQPRKNTNKGRQPGKTMIATDTPEKLQIRLAKEKKLKKGNKIKDKERNYKRKLELDDNLPKKKLPREETKEIPRKSKNIRKNKRPVHVLDQSSDEEVEGAVPLVDTDDDDSNDEECIFCYAAYRDDLLGEQWIKCIACKRWAHELCAGSEEHGWKTYTCDHCRN